MSIGRVLASPLIGLIRLYQNVISPMRPPTCRYYPSCSAYAVTALQTYGVLRGSAMATRRLLRCHPWSPGGVDHVPLADPVTGRPIPGTTGPRDIGSHSAADLRTSDTEAAANAAPRHPSHPH
ncbi:MAG TPA: membrane protein insertion efficiency factor YidD [Ornithinibacter sp.]|nr:membrane protein insertion efficiency factor YidD [Ornithinibacter sp.]HOB79539.1 membrane protein insertion efficiency factor YidD [Ornithinibacter sp.]